MTKPMVRLKSAETIQKHRKLVINTQHDVMFHGNRSLVPRISTQKLMCVVLEWPRRDLFDVPGPRGWGSTTKQNRYTSTQQSKKQTTRGMCVCE